jgi:hypothetical protein
MRYDHTPLEELGKTRRPRKVRVPLVTPVQDKFKSMSKADQNTCKILYKTFIDLSGVPVPAQWDTLEVKMDWSMQLFKLLNTDFRVRIGKADHFKPFMDWVASKAFWIKEIWFRYQKGKNGKYKNPCAKFCGEFDWIAMDYATQQRIHAIKERQALEKTEEYNSPSRREYMLPKFEDHPEIELPDDLEESECYLVRAFGGEIEVRVKPKGERMAGRHNPQTGVRDL